MQSPFIFCQTTDYTVASVRGMSQPQRLFPADQTTDVAQTCFMWANMHADKAALVGEAVKPSWMSRCPESGIHRNAEFLVWLLDGEDTSKIYWRQLHPCKEWHEVKGQKRKLTLNSGPTFFCQPLKTPWQTKQRAMSPSVNLDTKTKLFFFSFFLSKKKKLTYCNRGPL